jgi:hypothetical protein
MYPNYFCYCMLIITWTHYVLRAQRAYMEDFHEQAEGDGYIIWGKGIHIYEYVFAGGDVRYNL